MRETPTLPPNTPQYFFDDAWIDHQQRLVRRWLPAKIHPQPVICPDRPWEDRTLAFHGTVLPHPDDGLRLYYNNMVRSTPGESDKLFLATSADGFTWHKPELGVVEWKGTRANNIVLAPPDGMDSPSIAHDPDDPDAPYKLLVFRSPGGGAWGDDAGLYTYASRDGLKWTPSPGVAVRAGDRTNLMTHRVDGVFVAYTRHFDMFAQTGSRAVYRTESPDLRTWSDLRLVMAPDLNDEPNTQIYGMSVFIRNGWYFGLVEYWHDTPDVIETCLAISRDGSTWTRPVPRTPFIAATFDWNRAWSSCASNGPIVLNEQMVFYFGGRWESHSYDSVHQYGAIGMASLPLDRFCALESINGGTVQTPAFEWPGGELAVNADTRQDFTSHPLSCNGSLGVEILDEAGSPIAAWSGENRARFHGNTHAKATLADPTVRWPEGRGCADLTGQRIRLRFLLDHARLFTFAALQSG